jgi:hypothetical protein
LGRFGKESKAHSSSQGIPTSLLMPPFNVIEESRPFALGAKALTYAEEAAEARKTTRENFIVYLYSSLNDKKIALLISCAPEICIPIGTIRSQEHCCNVFLDPNGQMK